MLLFGFRSSGIRYPVSGLTLHNEGGEDFPGDVKVLVFEERSLVERVTNERDLARVEERIAAACDSAKLASEIEVCAGVAGKPALFEQVAERRLARAGRAEQENCLGRAWARLASVIIHLP
jgi:hypothetical protein